MDGARHPWMQGCIQNVLQAVSTKASSFMHGQRRRLMQNQQHLVFKQHLHIRVHSRLQLCR
ncbi:MAG: hypothetical protein ACK55I_22250, partial [bacterium]